MSAATQGPSNAAQDAVTAGHLQDTTSVPVMPNKQVYSWTLETRLLAITGAVYMFVCFALQKKNYYCGCAKKNVLLGKL